MYEQFSEFYGVDIEYFFNFVRITWSILEREALIPDLEKYFLETNFFFTNFVRRVWFDNFTPMLQNVTFTKENFLAALNGSDENFNKYNKFLHDLGYSLGSIPEKAGEYYKSCFIDIIFVLSKYCLQMDEAKVMIYSFSHGELFF